MGTTKGKTLQLLNVDGNAKTIKGRKQGYATGILYLAPSNQSGVINVCPSASAGCRAACLFSAGRGRMPNVIKGRTRKTLLWANERETFLRQLHEDIRFLIGYAERNGLVPAVRLNGTSDISWEDFGVIQAFPNVQFYDYTKRISRMLPNSLARSLPNYHLTFSRSESNNAQAQIVSGLGGNVAVVFSSKNYPREFYGVQVVNGDENDLRFLDPSPCVVGLYAKGDAKKDASGFVVPV